MNCTTFLMRSCTKVKNEWRYTSTTQHDLVACTRTTFAFYLEKPKTYRKTEVYSIPLSRTYLMHHWRLPYHPTLHSPVT